MKPETFTELIQQALGDQLIAVVLYGSFAAGDYIEGQSDYNILLLAKEWRSVDLDTMRAPLEKWLKAGNPAPLCFTPDRFKDAADVFPMEMLDIAESHRVLYGEDPVKDIKVDLTHLRHQVEFELRSKLLKLRQTYLQLRKPDKDLHQLLIDSLSSFQAVCRGALRLFSKEIPTNKLAATSDLGKQLNVPVDSFESIQQLKKEPSLAKKRDMNELFDRYLSQIETIVDHIDATTPPEKL